MSQWLRDLGQILLSLPGLYSVGGAVLVLIAAPMANRFVFRRKRLEFLVRYNAKIGLIPENLDGTTNPDAHPEVQRVEDMLASLTVAMVRFRNVGTVDLRAGDFRRALSVRFGGRQIWDARVSRTTNEQVRRRVRESMVFQEDPGDGAVGPTDRFSPSVAGARRVLTQRLAQFLAWSTPPEVPADDPPDWRSLSFNQQFLLERGEAFTLVVVLYGPTTDPRDPNEPVQVNEGPLHVTEPRITADIPGGRLLNGLQTSRVRWTTASVLLAVLLIGVLLTALITAPVRPRVDVACGTGSLRITGSSAFAPSISNIAEEYRKSCPEATITVQPNGSITGVREIDQAQPAEAGSLAALSDGRTTVRSTELEAQPAAVIVYAMVLNRGIGLDRLTVDQVRGIFAGRYTDWSQLRPGPALPIRVVGRGQESGTRPTFERAVLGGSEGGLSSDDCRDRRPNSPPAPVIRCERSTTAEVLTDVGAIDGAIGYADAPAARSAAAVTTAQLDGRYPDVATVPQGYPFWTVEYLYTKGVPPNGSLLKSFLDYLSNGAARAELADAGYTPCVGRDGLRYPLCLTGPS